jgi:hypothetical protein
VGSIYRFERIGRFSQLVEETALTFVLPELWPDKNEGFLFRAVESEEGVHKVQEAILKIRPTPHGMEIGFLQIYKRSRYAQCWSKCPENDALWKGYQVRIEVDRDDIPRLDGVKAYDVRYVDSINLEDELKSFFVYLNGGSIGFNLENALLTKRMVFSHEQEVRLLTEIVEKNVVDRQPDWAIPALVEISRREYKEGKITKEQFQQEVDKVTISRMKKVAFAHVPNFIRSVMLHPHAPTRIDIEMARFCAKHSLKYLGKSKMYELSL